MRAPRALACSSSSTSRIAAPSAITNPARSMLNGRDARVGSSRSSTRARIAQKPARITGTIDDSVPPATITSASSRLITSAASPIEWVPLAQAETMQWLMPRMPNMVAMWLVVVSISMLGSQWGETRAGPRSSSTCCSSMIRGRPPAALPRMTPVRVGSVTSKFASFSASTAAATPKCTSRLTLRASLADIAMFGSKSLTSAAIDTGKLSASNARMKSTPLLPATRLDQVVGTSLPTGVTAPRPVITARRIGRWDGGGVSRVALLADLTLADHHVLGGGQVLEADRPARMQAIRRDADLGAHAVLAAVGEAGRRVHVHGRGVHLAGEPLGGGLVLGDDRLGMARAVAGDVLERAVQRRHHAHAHLHVQELGRPRVLAVQQLDALRLQRCDQLR